MSDGLKCEFRIPLIWKQIDEVQTNILDTLREASLLLTAINNMEAIRDLEQTGPEQRRLERVESKLDLALYFLARALDQNLSEPLRDVHLTPEHIAWQDDAPPNEGQHLIIEFRPSEALPLSVRLPATAMSPQNGMARAQLVQVSETLADALYQFVFRCQRQAIRARLE